MVVISRKKGEKFRLLDTRTGYEQEYVIDEIEDKRVFVLFMGILYVYKLNNWFATTVSHERIKMVYMRSRMNRVKVVLNAEPYIRISRI